MKKQKGFTLVELLVTSTILGVITTISIPLIRNIQLRQEKKKYQTYLDGMEYSAKLYVDSYAEDLFGHEEAGCKIVSYSKLNERNLLKDIQMGDVSCDNDDTFVG